MARYVQGRDLCGALTGAAFQHTTQRDAKGWLTLAHGAKRCDVEASLVVAVLRADAVVV